jgi:hypothetical protein
MMMRARNMVLMLAFGLQVSACQPAGNQTRLEKHMIILNVSQKTVAGSILVGRIEFSETGRPVLQVINREQPGQKLRQAWQEILSKKTLSTVESRTVERNGEQIRQHGERMVSPGDKDYPWAVYDLLEREHGFDVEVE